MLKITVGENDDGRRLDRFLRKYLRNAPLSRVYSVIRKDVKVNGRREDAGYTLASGDEIALYIADSELSEYAREKTRAKAQRQFGIAYEDENLLIADKPFGLLTHGDATEKKRTLANQVQAYLAERGEYDPAKELTFVPSPVHRLDRNTTGLVIFGKNGPALRALNLLLREHDKINKRYLTIICGELKCPISLRGGIEKDEESNTVTVTPESSEEGKEAATFIQPVASGNGFTLAEVYLITGRTHQIRAHLSLGAGLPVLGDPKYGDARVNAQAKAAFGLTAQLLHAYRLDFGECPDPLGYLDGMTVTAPLPDKFADVCRALFGEETTRKYTDGKVNRK